VITLSRVALLAVLTLSTIVGCGPSVPAEVVYALSVPGGARHADSRVLRDGAPIGTLADRVLVRVPSSVRPGDLHLTVEVRAICGMRTVPLELQQPLPVYDDERIAREMEVYGELGVTALDPFAALRQVTVIVDRAPDDTRPVFVGEMELAAPAPQHTLVQADCATDLPIRVGDEGLGTWHPSDGTTLVAVRTGCYAWRSIGYGTAAAGAARQLDLRTDRVRALEQGVPEYLFAAAPSSVWSSASAEVHSELQRVACP
jgi:hypothetical protein